MGHYKLFKKLENGYGDNIGQDCRDSKSPKANLLPVQKFVKEYNVENAKAQYRQEINPLKVMQSIDKIIRTY